MADIQADELPIETDNTEPEQLEVADVTAEEPELDAAIAALGEAEPEPAEEPAAEPEPVPAEESEVAQAAAAPIAQPAPAEEPEQLIASGQTAVPWWPFLAYLGAWVVILGLSAYFLMQSPTGLAFWELQAYGAVVLSGLVLTAIGLIMIPVVWLVVRSGLAKEQRKGLFVDALVKGAIATLSGVLLWWAVLVALDFFRTGRLL